MNTERPTSEQIKTSKELNEIRKEQDPYFSLQHLLHRGVDNVKERANPILAAQLFYNCANEYRKLSRARLLNFKTKKILDDIKDEAIILIKDNYKKFNPQNLANTLWSMATLNYRDEKFTSKLFQETEKKLSQFNPQNLANTLWSMAVLDVDNRKLLDDIINYVNKNDDFSDQEYCSIYQSLTYYDKIDVLTVGKQEKINQTMNKLLDKPPKINNFEKNVTDIVNEIIAKLKSDYYCANQAFESGYWIDIVVRSFKDKNIKIAIECEGVQFHYDQERNLFLKDQLREKILAKEGWKIIHVKSDEMCNSRILKDKIKTQILDNK